MLRHNYTLLHILFFVKLSYGAVARPGALRGLGHIGWRVVDLPVPVRLS
jgi:hypothetical protein